MLCSRSSRTGRPKTESDSSISPASVLSNVLTEIFIGSVLLLGAGIRRRSFHLRRSGFHARLPHLPRLAHFLLPPPLYLVTDHHPSPLRPRTSPANQISPSLLLALTPHNFFISPPLF